MIGVVVEAASIKLITRSGQVSEKHVHELDLLLGILMILSWFLWNVIYLLRFFDFAKGRKRALGEPVPHIVTNKADPERCRSFMCCHNTPDSDDEESPSDDMQQDLNVELLARCNKTSDVKASRTDAARAQMLPLPAQFEKVG